MGRNVGNARAKASLAVTFAVLAWCTSASAEVTPRAQGPSPASPASPAPLEPGRDLDAPNARTSADRSLSEAKPRPWRIGAIGGIGFPRPLAIEGMALIGDTVALGAEYGALPPVTIGGVQASLWSLAGDARVFPFHGPFFVGLRAGHQHVAASTTIPVSSIGSVPEELGLDSWFLNPRLGVLWVSRAGLAFGVELGVQFPIGPEVSSSLPLSLAPSVQNTAAALGSTVLPTVDVLRLGLVL